VTAHKKVNKDFFKKWTREMAYVLGFFAADGYITSPKQGGGFWCLDIRDKEHIEKIKLVVEAEHKISTRNRIDGTSYRLQIGSVEMCNDLRNLGFSERKTKSMVIPNVPKKYFTDFVRGYFDGDGNIWMGEIHKDRKRINRYIVLKLYFTSCSLRFLNELQTRLGFFGLTGGCIYTSKKKQFSRLQYSTINALKLYDFMYNKECASLFLDRKKRVFERYKDIKMRL